MTKEQFLAFSMPYGLKAEFTNTFGEVSIGELDGYYVDGYLFDCCRDEDAKPILHPLTDFRKLNLDVMDEIEIINIIDKANIIENANFRLVLRLVEEHFDLFGGIDSGDAIDVNTLETNPYK